MRVVYVGLPLAVLVLASAVFAQEGNVAKKSPIPADTAQQEATKLIKEVYGEEYAEAKTLAAKQALAKKLLDKANENKGDMAATFVMLRLARDIATQAGDCDLAFQAIDQMVDLYEIRPLEMKVGVLTKFTTMARMLEHHVAISRKATELLDDAVQADDFRIAKQLGDLALSEARKSRDKENVDEITRRLAEVATAAKAFEETKIAEGILRKTPSDPDANLVVGKYRCFVKGDWKSGLPMLALCNDEPLKALAKKDIKGATLSEEQARIGDGWWALTEKEDKVAGRQLKERARFWYLKGQSGLSGLVKDKIEKRLAAGVSDLPTSGNSQQIDLFKKIDLRRDTRLGDWQFRNGTMVMTTGSDNRAFLALPYKPSKRYHLCLVAQRIAGGRGSAFGIHLLVADRFPVEVVLDSYDPQGGVCSGLALIDGKDQAVPQTRHFERQTNRFWGDSQLRSTAMYVTIE